jgi:hypothetical protein
MTEEAQTKWRYLLGKGCKITLSQDGEGLAAEIQDSDVVVASFRRQALSALLADIADYSDYVQGIEG